MALNFFNDGYFASKVGIGTTSPSAKLHIASSANLDGILLTGDGSGSGMGTNQGRSIDFQFTATDSSFGSAIRFSIPNDTVHGGALTFHTDDTVGTLQQAMIIDQAQNVGIGTTTPYYKTDIRFANTDTSLSGGGSGNWGSNGIRVENTLNTVGTMAAIQLRNNDADIHIVSIRRGANDSDLGFFWEGVQKVLFENTGNATFAGDITVGGKTYPKINLTDNQGVARNFSVGTNNETFTVRNETAGSDAFTIENSNNATLAGDLTVSGGNIILGGTGRIQGIDTVSATTDAANKAYVDAHGGGLGPFLPLAGGTMTGNTKHNDDVFSYWGNSDDLSIQHNNSGQFAQMKNYTGDLYFTNTADDKDIIFQADNSTNGTETYFQLDGSNERILVKKEMSFLDNVKLKLGTGSAAGNEDLLLYHDGSNSYIQDNATGNLLITSNGTSVQINKGTTENMAEFIVDDAVKLYYNSAVRFQTESYGASVYNTAGATSQAVLRVGGSEGNQGSTLELAETLVNDVMTFGFAFINDGNSSNKLYLKRHNNSSSGDTVITLSRTDNDVSMSGNLSLALKATSSSTVAGDSGTTLTTKNYVDALTPGAGVFLPLAGGTMTGNIVMGDNDITGIDQLIFSSGTFLTDVSSNYLELRYASTTSGGMIVLDGDGTTQGYLYADGNATSSFGLLDGSGSWAVKCKEDAEVELRHDNSIKFQTSNTGVTITGTCLANDQFQIKQNTGARYTCQSDTDTGLGAFDLANGVSLISKDAKQITVKENNIKFDPYTANAVETTGSLNPNQSNQALTEDTLAQLCVDPDGNVVRGEQEGTWTFTRAQLNATLGNTLIAAPGTNKAIIVTESDWMVKYNATGTISGNQSFDIRQANIVQSAANISTLPGARINEIINATQGTPTNPSYGFCARDIPLTTRTYKTNVATTLNKKTNDQLPSGVISISIKLKYRIFNATTF